MHRVYSKSLFPANRKKYREICCDITAIDAANGSKAPSSVGRSQRPTGLAVDTKTNRLFVGGHNKTMLVLDAATGKRIANLPTGSGIDATAFDQRNHLVFFSNGEGYLAIIQEKSSDDYVALAPVTTQQSAKTVAFDNKTGKIFLPAAEVITMPASDPSQKPKHTITEGTFSVLAVGK